MTPRERDGEDVQKAREIEWTVLDLMRCHQQASEKVEDREREGKDAFYERGIAYGLSVALNHIERIRA